MNSLKTFSVLALLILAILSIGEWVLIHIGFIRLSYVKASIVDASSYEYSVIRDRGRRVKVQGNSYRVQYYYNEMLFDVFIDSGGELKEDDSVVVGFYAHDPSDLIVFNGKYAKGYLLGIALLCIIGAMICCCYSNFMKWKPHRGDCL